MPGFQGVAYGLTDKTQHSRTCKMQGFPGRKPQQMLVRLCGFLLGEPPDIYFFLHICLVGFSHSLLSILIFSCHPQGDVRRRLIIDAYRHVWRNAENHNYVLNIFITHIFHFRGRFSNTYILGNIPQKLFSSVVSFFA